MEASELGRAPQRRQGLAGSRLLASPLTPQRRAQAGQRRVLPQPQRLGRAARTQAMPSRTGEGTRRSVERAGDACDSRVVLGEEPAGPSPATSSSVQRLLSGRL